MRLLSREFSYEELVGILRTIHTEPAFSDIQKYIYANSGKFSSTELSNLTSLIGKRKSYFDPKNCNAVKEIRIWYQTEGAGQFTNSYTDGRAYALCHDAHEDGLTLPDLLNRMVKGSPNFVAWTIDATEPVSEKVSIVRERHEVSRRIIREAEEPELEEARKHEELEAVINVPDLLERYRRDVEELIDAATNRNIAEVEKLRQQINSLQSRIEAGQGPQPKEITRILDSTQYRYFLANSYKLKLPVRMDRIAKGQYRISIAVNNSDEENNALAFLSDVEAQERVTEHAGRMRPAGFDQVLDILCRNYTKASGIPCGLSRTGALSTLADRLIEYAISHDTEWDKMFDINSLDLFAKRGKIYTREQADEAFNNAVRQVEGKNLAMRMEQEITDECEPDTVQAFLMDFDAISVISAQHLAEPLPDALKERYDDAVKRLSTCGYYPNGLDSLRSMAEADFSHIGTSYDDQLSAMVDSLVRRYSTE